MESYEIITNEVAINEEETSLIQNEVEEDNQEDFSPTFDWSLFDDTSTTEVENSEELIESEIKEEPIIDVNEIEVVDYIELVSTEESNSEGEVIHELSDHIVIEPLLKENSEDFEMDVLIEEESNMELIKKDNEVENETIVSLNDEKTN